MSCACIGVFGLQVVQKNSEHEMIKVDGAHCGLELYGVYRSTFVWDHFPAFRLQSLVFGCWTGARNNTYVVLGERRS